MLKGLLSGVVFFYEGLHCMSTFRTSVTGVRCIKDYYSSTNRLVPLYCDHLQTMNTLYRNDAGMSMYVPET